MLSENKTVRKNAEYPNNRIDRCCLSDLKSDTYSNSFSPSDIYSEKITNIIDNADAMVTDAKTSVDTVKEGVIEPLSDTLIKLQSLFGKNKKRRRVGLPKRKRKESAK